MLKLERGKAKKSIFECTREEVEETGRKIFEEIMISSLYLGRMPAISANASQALIQCMEEVTGKKEIGQIQQNKIDDLGRLICKLFFERLRFQ